MSILFRKQEDFDAAAGAEDEKIGKMIKAVLLILLYLCSVQDWRTRQVSLKLMAAGAVFLGILILWKPVLPGIVSLAGIVEGLLMLLFGEVSGGKLGRADGMMLMITGMVTGGYDNLILMFISFTAAGITGGISTILGKRGRNQELPYLPFLFLAYAGSAVL